MVSEVNKPDYLLYKASDTDISADKMLVFKGPGNGKNGKVNIPLFEQMPDWKRITVEFIIKDALVTGIATGINFTGKTSNDYETALSSSSVDAKDGDGSTAFASGNLTTTGRTMISMVREEAANVCNIGAVLGFLADITSGTMYDYDVLVVVTR